jgi:hypothetical protein
MKKTVCTQNIYVKGKRSIAIEKWIFRCGQPHDYNEQQYIQYLLSYSKHDNIKKNIAMKSYGLHWWTNILWAFISSFLKLISFRFFRKNDTKAAYYLPSARNLDNMLGHIDPSTHSCKFWYHISLLFLFCVIEDRRKLNLCFLFFQYYM